MKVLLQIRINTFTKSKPSQNKSPSPILNQILKNKEKLKEHINKIETMKNGYNIYIKDKTQAPKFLSNLKKLGFYNITKSRKLVGEDKLNSKKLYKFIILLEIIDLNKKDIITYKGEEVEILKIDKNKNIIQIQRNRRETYEIIRNHETLHNKTHRELNSKK